MSNNFLNRTYKYVEKTTSFSYEFENIDNYKTNIDLLNSMRKKGITVKYILAVESHDLGERPVVHKYKNLQEFINDKDVLTSKSIYKVIDFCSQNSVDFEIHVIPDFPKIDVIFTNYRKENDDSIDSLINESVKTR